jgi:hypothetical protein
MKTLRPLYDIIVGSKKKQPTHLYLTESLASKLDKIEQDDESITLTFDLRVNHSVEVMWVDVKGYKTTEVDSTKQIYYDPYSIESLQRTRAHFLSPVIIFTFDLKRSNDEDE